MRVEVSRFNATTFELVQPATKQRAFAKREDPEFLACLDAESAHATRLKRMPFGLGRLFGEPTIEITDARWGQLRARISGAIRIPRMDPT